jgi:hypothetical protein
VLNDGHVEGDDPLTVFGPRARQHLLRVSSFMNVPDLLVNSFYDPSLDEAAAFEELIGGHGGLGGKQMHPFLIYPAEIALDETTPIIGAEELHQVLLRFVDGRTPETPAAAQPSAVTESEVQALA